jgi:opine dehydrogenase
MTEGLRDEPVVILGGGNSALAMAGDLALQGREVRLYEHESQADSFQALREKRKLVVQSGGAGEKTQEVRLTMATHDLEEAMAGVSFIHLVVPSFVQDLFFGQLLPLLRPAHTVVVWAGRFGASRLAHLCHTSTGKQADFTIVEASTVPYGSRKVGEAQVRINFRAICFYAAALPETETPRVVAALRAYYPCLEPIESTMAAAFHNSALPILSIGALLNTGAIESRAGKFSLFRDGLTPAVRAAVRAVHEDMRAVGEAFGFPFKTYSDEVYDGPASIEGFHYRDEAGGTDGFLNLTGPDKIHHRYTIENVRYGLAVIADLGRSRGVPTPTIDAFCKVADVVCGPDFAAQGRSLADLGLKD